MQHFDRESFFLSCLKKQQVTKGIGDDCCIIDMQDSPPKHTHIAHIKSANLKSLVVGMDSFCEGVHFLKDWFSPYELATKAFLVNYSDIIAMNATPLYATLSVGLPKYWLKGDIATFTQAIGDFCRACKIHLIGGDTIKSSSLQIHITLFAKPHKHTLYRDKIPTNSLLCYTCDTYPKYTITRSYKVLKMLLAPANKGKLRASGRFLAPSIRAKFIRECAPFLKGGMDISDGILSDTLQLCKLNHLYFKPYKSFFSAHTRSLLQSGESYEMLLSLLPKDLRRLKMRAARYRIRIQTLGVFTRIKHKLPPPRFWH